MIVKCLKCGNIEELNSWRDIDADFDMKTNEVHCYKCHEMRKCEILYLNDDKTAEDFK